LDDETVPAKICSITNHANACRQPSRHELLDSF